MKGFDKLIEGGFPENSTIVVTGSPGTGKTLLGLEYIYQGARIGEKGVFISFEQSEKDIKEQMKQLNFKYASPKFKSKILIKHIPVENINSETTKEIISICNSFRAKRLVIDSLSTLSINAPIFSNIDDVTSTILSKESVFSPPVIGDVLIYRFIYLFVSNIKKLKGVTTLLIADDSSVVFNSTALSEFLTDGVVEITFQSLGGSFSRALRIKKMRKTKNDDDIHPLEISPKGLVIHDLQD